MIFIEKAKNYLKDNAGVSAVEFSLIAPMLLLIVVGTVDYGTFVTDRMRLHATAFAAADYVTQVQDDTNVGAVASETYGDNYEDVTLTSEFSCECSDGVELACPVACGEDDYQRRFINVTAAASFDPLFPYPGMPDTLNLQSTVKMRVD